ncbi:MAG: AMP-binding protein, partial [Pseudomonadota bacterium]
GRGDQAALIYDSPVTNTQRSYTYKELQQEVGALAAVLGDFGVKAGDRIIIYMPMIPQAVFSMLACARIGAVHSVVFGGFSSHELASRIDDTAPNLVISASCGIEPGRIVAYKPLLDEAISLAKEKPEHCLILQREQQVCDIIAGRDHDFLALQAKAKAQGRIADCVTVSATDPLYILYTSGTTGKPKGIVRDNGGHMVALKWTMENIYDTKPAEVFWAASDVGWVVGHSYICYAPLLHGSTTIVYEGKPIGTPDAGAFWRVIADHKVATLFTAPTALRAIKKEDSQGSLIKNYDLSHFRSLFLAGERSEAATINWASEHLQRPVIDHWWQTETGWAIAANPIGLGVLPIKPGSPGVPIPGFDIEVLDDEGNAVGPGTLGNIVNRMPLPPSCTPTVWRDDERFFDSYLREFPGYYNTSDAGVMDEDGYVFVMARTDDIINVAGHRLSTGAMEEVIVMHPDIAECAVVGVADAIKGQLPIGLYVTNSGVDRAWSEVEKELVGLVREKIGPVAAFKTAIEVRGLPKTRSGKIVRAIIQKIADGTEWKMPATIDEPTILDHMQEVLEARGFGKPQL